LPGSLRTGAEDARAMSDQPHILIVDDDREIRALLAKYLETNGFRTTPVADGKAMNAALQQGHFDLIVLDLMLPGEDGLTLCRELRRHSQVPIIMLTARGEDVDRIVGLEVGADDYLAKPFNPRELLVRIKAILRRSEGTVNRGRIEVNGVALDPATRQVHTDGQPIELTTLEFDILEQLMRSAGRELSRDALMESLYGRNATP